MGILKRTRTLFFSILVVLMAAISAPVQAGQAEVDLLQSYVGSWRGDGTLEGGDTPETFRCRLEIAKGNQSKINYAGRCSLARLNLSVNGTIFYSEENQHHEAAMTSNSSFSGLAVGMLEDDDTIVFNLSETTNENPDNKMSIGSRILLHEGIITVEFDVIFNDSDKTLSASVPFSR